MLKNLINVLCAFLECKVLCVPLEFCYQNLFEILFMTSQSYMTLI